MSNMYLSIQWAKYFSDIRMRVGVGYLLPRYFTCVIFLALMYKAHKNLKQFHGDPFSYTT